MFQRNLTSFDTDLHISAAKTRSIKKLYQCFAVFFDDTSSPPGIQYLKDCIDYFKPIIARQKNIVPIYTTEGGCVLQANPDNIAVLKELDIRIFGFVWNGRNALATGAYTDNTRGLSTLGFECLKRLYENRIFPDVSHLSEQGFYDIASRDGTMLATHSNARSICDDLRNLTDEQISHIVRVGGLIGLNMNAPFLSKENAGIDDILRHAYHILQLGGEHALALGCDFDGIRLLPAGVGGAGDIPKIAAAFTEEFGQEVCENILYKNVLRVLEIKDEEK